ncbi:MAG: RNA polymerase factor sigma-54 [Kiritimatiellae bacterium]|nr:RNA polymerase factor sigma-54 [Kiritimatiellia bacterium]MBR3777585.1 RNA polymerase factor sigma-54 [Kiritimatiellia bacterium]
MPQNLSRLHRQTQSQSMVLAPRMLRGLDMLAMSLPELRAELNRELETNPVIEDVERTLEKDTVSQKEREAADRERSQEDDYPEDDSAPDSFYEADAEAMDRRRSFLESRTTEETLEEHLLSQIATSEIDEAHFQLAEILIGELNDDGYFSGSIPDLVMVTGESEEKIREVLGVIMTFDPPGCGATTLEECLLAQIDKLDSSPYQDEVRELLENRLLKDVAEGRLSNVEKALGISHERYADVLSALRTLDPRPARAYSRSGKGVNYVNPEVHAVKTVNGWEARVDARSLPEIRISPRYLKMLEDPATDAETKEYIRAKIASVKELKDAIAKREETVTNIAQAIFDAQSGFFEHGLKGLRPLTMQEIADAVGVHAATVSRTVNDKYVSTPRGTVELRRFFVSGFATADGGVVSKDTVYEALKEIVGSEDRSKPFSDDKISELLKAKGYSVARRTVAKYRAALGIPGASERAG